VTTPLRVSSMPAGSARGAAAQDRRIKGDAQRRGSSAGASAEASSASVDPSNTTHGGGRRGYSSAGRYSARQAAAAMSFFWTLPLGLQSQVPLEMGMRTVCRGVLDSL
jgi:hypothetical protein